MSRKFQDEVIEIFNSVITVSDEKYHSRSNLRMWCHTTLLVTVIAEIINLTTHALHILHGTWPQTRREMSCRLEYTLLYVLVVVCDGGGRKTFIYLWMAPGSATWLWWCWWYTATWASFGINCHSQLYTIYVNLSHTYGKLVQ